MAARSQALRGLHAAMLLSGGTALFSKLIDLSATAISAGRSLFAVLTLMVVIAGGRRSVRLASRREYALLGVVGLAFALHWVTFFHAMQVASVAVGVVALFTFPVLTAMIEPLVHGERPRASDIAAAGLVFVGVYLMVPDSGSGGAVARGAAWGLLSAVLYAMRNIMQRACFSDYPPSVVVFWQIMVVLLVTVPSTVNAVGGSEQIGQISASQWALLALLGVVFTAVPHTLIAHSLSYFSAARVSLVNCLQVLYAVMFAAVLLGETPGVGTLAGGSLIVVAAVWESVWGLFREAPGRARSG